MSETGTDDHLSAPPARWATVFQVVVLSVCAAGCFIGVSADVDESAWLSDIPRPAFGVMGVLLALAAIAGIPSFWWPPIEQRGNRLFLHQRVLHRRTVDIASIESIGPVSKVPLGPLRSVYTNRESKFRGFPITTADEVLWIGRTEPRSLESVRRELIRLTGARPAGHRTR